MKKQLVILAICATQGFSSNLYTYDFEQSKNIENAKAVKEGLKSVMPSIDNLFHLIIKNKIKDKEENLISYYTTDNLRQVGVSELWGNAIALDIIGETAKKEILINKYFRDKNCHLNLKDCVSNITNEEELNHITNKYTFIQELLNSKTFTYIKPLQIELTINIKKDGDLIDLYSKIFPFKNKNELEEILELNNVPIKYLNSFMRLQNYKNKIYTDKVLINQISSNEYKVLYRNDEIDLSIYFSAKYNTQDEVFEIVNYSDNNNLQYDIDLNIHKIYIK